MLRSRTIRWVLLVAAITALGYLGWQKFHGDNHPAQADARKAAPARNRGPRQDCSGREGRLPGVSDRPRHRSGLQHRPGSDPRRRPDQQDRISGRPVRQGRRHAGRDRSAAVPGCVRPGQGQEGPGRSQSRQRQTRPAALHQARRIRNPATDRYAALYRRAIDRADCRRHGADRERADPARLRHRQGADSPASRGCARSTSATSSTPRPKPAS